MTVFYRKYRPQKLADLGGQEKIKENLLQQLESGKIGHGYLFYGPRGSGKTSAARIFAKAVNCEIYQSRTNSKSQIPNPKFGEPCNKCLSCTSITDGSNLDLIEIDAASNRGIDEIRDLREKIKLSPVSSNFKVYIIDEAHMLTPEAFNALLKTLEEPPSHAIFILCTTEVSKLPSTIVSRLQRFNFSRASREDLVKVLVKITKTEGIKINEESLWVIAQSADGSFRDAVSFLDQLSATKKDVKLLDVKALLKATASGELDKFCDNLAGKNLRELVVQIEDIAESGGDVMLFARQVVLYLEKVLFVKLGIGDLNFGDENDEISKFKKISERFDFSEIQNVMRSLLVSEAEMKLYPLSQIPLVLAVCKYCGEEVEESRVRSQDSRVRDKDEELDDAKALTDKQKTKSVAEVSGIDVEEDLGEPKVKSGKQGVVGAKSIAEVEKNWGEFLNRVRPLNAHVVALLRSTRPFEFDGTRLTLEVFYRFHKEKLEEPKIVRMLDEIMEQVMKRPVKLKFILADKKTLPTKAVSASDVVDINQNELEMMAQEIFSK
jgi:DNA polymerase-3 subunit gamma/tau